MWIVWAISALSTALVASSVFLCRGDSKATPRRAPFLGLAALCLGLLPQTTAPEQADEEPPGLVLQTGHAKKVSRLLFSPDGRWLATSSHDRTVKLWDASSGLELRTLSGHSDSVSGLAVSPDGGLLASAGDDFTVRLWDVRTGRQVQSLSGHSAAVRTVAFSSDGAVLASGSIDGELRLWELATGRLLRSTVYQEDSIYSLEFSPDDRFLAWRRALGGIRVTEVGDGCGEISLTMGNLQPGGELAFSADGRRLAAADGKGASVFSIPDGQELRSLPGVPLSYAAFSPDGSWLAEALGHKVRLWEIASGASRTLSDHQTRVQSIAFSPDGRRLVSTHHFGAVRVWDRDTGKQLLVVGDSLGQPTTLAVSPDSRLLAVGTLSGRVRLWEMPSAQRLHDLHLPEPRRGDEVAALAFSPQGAWLAVAHHNGIVSLWEPDSGRLVRQLAERSSPVDLLAFESEETLVAIFGSGTVSRLRTPSGCEIGSASLEDLSRGDLPLDHRWKASGNEAGTLSLVWHANVGQTAEYGDLDIRAAAVGPAGRRLAIAKFGRLSLKDGDSGERLWQVRPFEFETADAVAFSPSGRWLAAGGRAGLLSLRDAASGRELWRRNGLGKPFSSLVFAEDQSWLAGVTRDGRLFIWEVETGTELGVVDAPTPELRASISSARFSPDGELLLLAGDEAIELRAADDGRLQHELAFADAKELALSPDGRLLAALNRDSVKLWKMPGAVEFKRLPGDFSTLAFSPDGRTLAALPLEGKAVLLDAATGSTVRELGDAQGDVVLRTLFSPDGSRIAFVTSNQLQVWDTVGGNLVSRLPLSPENGGVIAAHFSPSGRALTFVDFNGDLRFWRIGGERSENLPPGHRGAVVSLRFHPQGDWLATAGADGAVQLWDPETGRRQKRVIETGGGGSLAVDPQGQRLAAFEKNLKIWEVSTGRLVAESSTTADRNQQTTGVALSPNGRWIAVSTGAAVQLWEVESGRMLHALTGANGVFSTDGSRIATFEETGPIHIWEVDTGRQIKVLDGRPARFSLFDRAWKLAASMRRDGTLELWDISSGEIRRPLGKYYLGAPSAVAFSPAGDRLAVRGWEKISILDTRTGRPEATLPIDGVFSAVAFSPDGRRLAASGANAQIQIWEVESWRPLASLDASTPIDLSQLSDDVRELLGMVGRSPSAELRGLGGGSLDSVSVLAFSPRGDRLAYGKEVGGVIGIWDFAAGRSRHWEAHTEAVAALAFNPRETWLLSAALDGSVRIWNPETQNLHASLVSAGGADEWLVVAPDGLFDGSPDAWRRILWRFRGDTLDTVPVEQFFTDFFRPGLLAEVLAGRPPKAPKRLAKLERRQPQVELALAAGFKGGAVSKRKATLRIKVAEAQADPVHQSGSGVRDLRLFRNGSLVRAWRGALGGESGQAELEASVTLLAGENLFTAYAFNRDNIKSADSTLLVQGDSGLARPGSLHILTIGVDRYASSDLNLRFAVADANEFAEQVRRRQLQLERFQSVNVISLRDEEATKANILGALEGLASGSESPDSPPVRPEDVVVLFYAGHGTALEERFYLIPHEAGWGRWGLAISDRELDRAFERIDAGVFLVVIDACNSGQLLESQERRLGPLNSKGLAQLAYEKGMYILTAAQSYQAALEADELGHGFLTHVLVEEGLKALRADAAPADGRLLLREWLDYATKRVPQMQAERMRLEKGRGRDLAFVEGEQSIADPAARSLQRPRAYYRRGPRRHEFVVASSSPTGAKDQ